jgi:precorrin-2 dehydrogenase/sirohydrochlorin ferrochelatase
VKYYPVFLNLNNKKAVVVGGGKVAERKVRNLINAGACVKVVSPAITKGLERLKKKGLLTHVARPYRRGDVRDAFLVIAGTSSEKTNVKIAGDAPHLVNVIDTPSEGNFIAPSVVKRGPMTIAVSTEGCSPAAARTVRRELERLYGTEFAGYLRFLAVVRRKAMKEIKNRGERERFLKKLASEEVFNKLRKKGHKFLSENLPVKMK